jgi:hypothetical protein
LVDEVGDKLNVDRARKTFVNYWFRHIWEYIFPLYPSMMLAAALMGLPAVRLTEAAWPLTLSAIVGGLLFGLLGVPRRGTDDLARSSRAENLRTLVDSTWPIVLVIILSMTLPLDERLRMLIGMVITIAALMTVKHVPPRDLLTIWRQRIPWSTVVVIFGALIFRRVLDNSGAVAATSAALTDMHIPLAAVTFAVPFIAGLLTGLSAAAFSIGFPVVLPLVVADGETITLAWAAWLMAGGFLGVMWSPMHLCLALTRVYFKASWGPIYRLIAPSTALVAATAAVILLLA